MMKRSILFWDAHLKRVSKVYLNIPLQEIRNTPYSFIVYTSDSCGGAGNVRDRVLWREDSEVSFIDHVYPTNTLGCGRMAEAFAQTMKPTAINDLYPKMDVGKHNPQEMNGSPNNLNNVTTMIGVAPIKGGTNLFVVNREDRSLSCSTKTEAKIDNVYFLLLLPLLLLLL